MVIFRHRGWPKELNEKVDAYLTRGGGLVLLHFAVDFSDNPEAGRKNLGLYWGPGAKFRHGPVELKFNERAEDLLRGLSGRTVRFHDESYWRLSGSSEGLNVLATAIEDDGGTKLKVPLVWNRQVGKGRVHVNILGHCNWTFNDPVFRAMVLRGISWAAGRSADRLTELALSGVKLADPAADSGERKSGLGEAELRQRGPGR